MMATRHANALHPDVEMELQQNTKKREEWAVSAKKKRIDPILPFLYPDLECYSVDFIVTTYAGQRVP